MARTGKRTEPWRVAVATLVLAATLPGCARIDGWLRGGDAAAPRERVVLGAPGAESYLLELQRLATGDPYVQVEIHADAESAATLTPNPSSQLRYALVLATPGHAGANVETAATMLRELLAQTEMMTQSEVALATVYLKNVDERLVLDAEARRLRSASAEAQSVEQRAVAQRIEAIEAENTRLRQELTESQGKLEAITSIERSIRAQDEAQNNDTG